MGRPSANRSAHPIHTQETPQTPQTPQTGDRYASTHPLSIEGTDTKGSTTPRALQQLNALRLGTCDATQSPPTSGPSPNPPRHVPFPRPIAAPWRRGFSERNRRLTGRRRCLPVELAGPRTVIRTSYRAQDLAASSQGNRTIAR